MSVKVPLTGLVTRTAVKVLFSASVSFVRTLVIPPDNNVAVSPFLIVIWSDKATGASFTGLIVIVTVAISLSDVPSLTL